MPALNSRQFSGETKAIDGMIATFDKDGDRWSRHFTQEVSRPHYRGDRTRIGIGPTAAQQIIAYADQHEAKVVCISSPTTILRDLSGTRRGRAIQDKLVLGQMRESESIDYPERVILRGCKDLFLEPTRTIDIQAEGVARMSRRRRT